MNEQDLIGQLSWVERIDTRRLWFAGRSYFLAKRVFDLAVIVLVAPAWLPLLALTALLIKLESPPDPIFFNQNRTGLNGRRFRMHKFRTMIPEAEQTKEHLQHLNELAWPDFKISHDPRVTKIGGILRSLSLDELPQLLNVIKGEMSLVGPRPTSFAPDRYETWQTARLEVLPGITGLWQIVGRGATDFTTRVRLDHLYIRKRCLWLDCQILFRTFDSVLRQRGTF